MKVKQMPEIARREWYSHQATPEVMANIDKALEVFGPSLDGRAAYELRFTILKALYGDHEVGKDLTEQVEQWRYAKTEARKLAAMADSNLISKVRRECEK